MRFVRIITTPAASALFLLTLVYDQGSRYYVLLMIAISVTAVLDNGLEATVITKLRQTVLELGRYMDIQNTYQRPMAAAAPPLFGILTADATYPPTWVLRGFFPLASAPLVPMR